MIHNHQDKEIKQLIISPYWHLKVKWLNEHANCLQLLYFVLIWQSVVFFVGNHSLETAVHLVSCRGSESAADGAAATLPWLWKTSKHKLNCWPSPPWCCSHFVFSYWSINSAGAKPRLAADACRKFILLKHGWIYHIWCYLSNLLLLVSIVC